MKNLDDILKGTSRAFYLTLRALPEESQAPMSLAYMLARAADTIADSECSPEVERAPYLLGLSSAIADSEHGLPSLENFCPQSTSERELLGVTPDLIRILHHQAGEYKNAIQDVVETLITGMLWDQERFDSRTGPAFGGLSDDEFEEYCYLVAGCVGPFWSKVCVLSNPRHSALLSEQNLEVSRRFGKALQHVNILRDIPADQAMNRYYLPALEREEFSRRFVDHSQRALEHFRTASAYPNLFETWEIRHKVSVLLPLILGLRTLEKLFLSGFPRPNTRTKVQRVEVLVWLALSPLIVILPKCLPKLLEHLADRVELALSQLEKTL